MNDHTFASSSSSSFSIDENARDSRVVRFAMDPQLRTIAIIEAYIGTPTLTSFVPNTSSPYESLLNSTKVPSSPSASAPSSSTAVRRYRQFIGIVLERCGAVTLVEGLLPPVRCLITTLPYRLRFLAPLLRNFTNTLAITIQNCILNVPVGSFLTVNAGSTGKASSSSSPTNDISSIPPVQSTLPSSTLTWFHTYLEEMLQELPSDVPLNWSTDANELLYSWCRSFSQSCDPFVPGLEAIENSNGTVPHPYTSVSSPSSSSSSSSSAVTTDNFRNYLLNIRDRAVTIRLDSLRYDKFFPVIYWTPQCYIVNQSLDGHQCTGYAYNIRNKPYIIPIPSLMMNHQSPTSTIPSNEPILMDPTIPEPVPEMDIYEVQGNKDGYLSFIKLPLPHVVMEDDERYRLSRNLPYSLASLPGTSHGHLRIDPRDLSIRRLLIDAGYLDPRAAHETSIRLACIMRQIFTKQSSTETTENTTATEKKHTVPPNPLAFVQQDVPHTNPIAGFSPLKSPYRDTPITSPSATDTDPSNPFLRISTIPALHIDTTSTIDAQLTKQGSMYNSTSIHQLHYTLIPALHAQGALRRAGWIAALMTKIGPTVVNEAYRMYRPIMEQLFTTTMMMTTTTLTEEDTLSTVSTGTNEHILDPQHRYAPSTEEHSSSLFAYRPYPLLTVPVREGVVKPLLPVENEGYYYHNASLQSSVYPTIPPSSSSMDDQQFSYQALQLAVARSLRHSEFILELTNPG